MAEIQLERDEMSSEIRKMAKWFSWHHSDGLAVGFGFKGAKFRLQATGNHGIDKLGPKFVNNQIQYALLRIPEGQKKFGTKINQDIVLIWRGMQSSCDYHNGPNDEYKTQCHD